MHAREVAAVHALPVVITAVSAPRSTCFIQNPCNTVAQGKGVAKGFCRGYHDEYCKVHGCLIAMQVRQVAADPRPSSEDD